MKCWVLLAALLASCSLQHLLASEGAPQGTVVAYMNPHSDCSACHETGAKNPAQLIEKTDPSSICGDCHDYKENHHPVDFRPSITIDSQFPLYEGKIRCLTCHEIHGGQKHEGTPKLLRGGPYADRRTICFKCHRFEEFARINPHKMLNDDGSFRMVNGKAVCLICHAKQPNPAVDRTQNVRFRADVGFLCWRCHPPMPGSFFSQHFLVKPSPETLKTMQETEERLLVILPLVPRGRITCSTCHNPHQKGVILHEAAAKGADAFARLRLPSLCSACHKI